MFARIFLAFRTSFAFLDHSLYPIGSSRYLYYLRMVDESVDDCIRYDGITEDLAPFRKGLIGGDDDGPLLVSGCHKLEEQPCYVPVDRKISYLVDDEQLVLVQVPYRIFRMLNLCLVL